MQLKRGGEKEGSHRGRRQTWLMANSKCKQKAVRAACMQTGKELEQHGHGNKKNNKSNCTRFEQRKAFRSIKNKPNSSICTFTSRKKHKAAASSCFGNKKPTILCNKTGRRLVGHGVGVEGGGAKVHKDSVCIPVSEHGRREHCGKLVTLSNSW